MRGHWYQVRLISGMKTITAHVVDLTDTSAAPFDDSITINNAPAYGGYFGQMPDGTQTPQGIRWDDLAFNSLENWSYYLHPSALQPSGERFARNQFHRQEVEAFRVVEIKHHRDIGVIQFGKRQRFFPEALARLLIGHLAFHDGVFEFPDVARPVVRRHRLERPGAEAFRRHAVALAGP